MLSEQHKENIKKGMNDFWDKEKGEDCSQDCQTDYYFSITNENHLFVFVVLFVNVTKSNPKHFV